MKSIDPSVNEPKILVISNNAFSGTKNNGKTLASFFDIFAASSIAQLYFSDEIPNGTPVENFYQITDVDIVYSILNRTYTCGRKIYKISYDAKSDNENRSSRFFESVKKFDIVRLARELLWKLGNWKSYDFQRWLDEFSPEIIFLCAGDAGFAYDISRYVQKKFNTKFIIYVTDDYVLPRKTTNLFWWIRRNFIYRKMKATVKASDLFMTVSEEMRLTYKKLYGVDSILVMNMTHSWKEINNNEPENMKQQITLVYAGGIHFKRYFTLSLLAEAIKKYNLKAKGKKAFLEIYLGAEPDKGVVKYLNNKGASKYCGTLNQTELRTVLNQSDILVHVESFNPKSIESTRLSISTKIPEYLSMGKPILAIGPGEVASMKYLEDSAFCVTESDSICLELSRLLGDAELLKVLSQKSLDKYQKYHMKEVISRQLMYSIISLSENNQPTS